MNVIENFWYPDYNVQVAIRKFEYVSGIWPKNPSKIIYWPFLPSTLTW